MKLTNNLLILPEKTSEIKKILQDAAAYEKKIAKTIKVTGITKIATANNLSLTDFIFTGLTVLHNKYNSVFSEVDALIVVSQTYDHRIPSISTRVQSKFNLPSDIFCIDIMDGCAGYIKALKVASLLELKGYKKIMIIAGEINSLMTSKADVGTRILFGDGVSVSIIEADDSSFDAIILNNGDHKNTISCNMKDNIFKMNGVEVFNFTRHKVPSLINHFLEKTKKSLKHYDLFAVHQASKLVVDNICSTLNYQNKLGDNFLCGNIGNLQSGSIGAWLANIKDLDKKGKINMLATGFGAGISWGVASIVVEINKNEIVYV